MLTIFIMQNGCLEHYKVRSIEDLKKDALWIDLREPTERELDWVGQVYNQRLPDPDDENDIEESARFYEDNQGIHITSFFLYNNDSGHHIIPVTFTLHQGRIFTRRAEDLSVFRAFRMRARRQMGLAVDALGIMLELLDTKVEVMADALEDTYASLDTLAHLVLSPTEIGMTDAISQLAVSEDINGKARLILMDNQRILSYLGRRTTLNEEQREHVRAMMRDIEALIAHTSFLFDKINFLMDTTMGMINIEQNRVIKIFSIAAVVFLPPTLLASIWGMNFEFMPDLHLQYGYFFSLLLMVVAGVTPYLYFKYKGWL
ncbi:Magnesium transport protein CorA [Gammaproteobacteria bacterium]